MADQPPPIEPPANVTLVVVRVPHCHKSALSGTPMSKRRKLARCMNRKCRGFYCSWGMLSTSGGCGTVFKKA